METKQVVYAYKIYCGFSELMSKEAVYTTKEKAEAAAEAFLEEHLTDDHTVYYGIREIPLL